MKTNVTIEGTYQKEGSSYFHTTFQYRIVKGHRQVKGNKPPDFLILKPCCGAVELPNGKKEQYVSAIYWTSSNTAKIDFEGKNYEVLFKNDLLEVRLFCGGKSVV